MRYISHAANFTYPTPKTSFTCQDVVIHPDGTFTTTPGRPFAITKDYQIANYADFCNECGNCDTFCPEYGGPFIQKPNFFSTEHSYSTSKRDGFLVSLAESHPSIKGRINGVEYTLTHDVPHSRYRFTTPVAEITFSAEAHAPLSVCSSETTQVQVDTWPYHTLRHLLHGVLDTKHVHQLNASLVGVG